jgi:hypothetical protein
MQIDRSALRDEIHNLYRAEHEALGEGGTLDLLERGRAWDLSGTLATGGVVVFPHAGVADCGHQIAAAVHAALDCGADRVVVISVLHAFTDDMEAARIRVANGGDPSAEPYWGIQGPGITGRAEWLNDHALFSFRHFWNAETQRRGIHGPQVIERYPYLAGGQPDKLPGIEELARQCEGAAVLSTVDPFHHGIGYGDLPNRSLYPLEGGLDLARRTIEQGIRLLEAGDYWGYNQHCVQAKSDGRDAGQVFRYLRGPMRGEVLDLSYTDASDLYKSPPPTWVAAALFDWRPTG